MILLTLLIPSTTRSEVLKPEDYPGIAGAIAEAELFVDDWLLIQEGTLRALSKDAKAYKLTLEKLNEAQEQQTEDVRVHNKLRKELYEARNLAYMLELENNELKSHQWWESPIFWGVTSAAVGFIAGGIVFAYATGGL